MNLTEYSPPELPASVADRIAAAVGIGQAQTLRFAAALAGLFELARRFHAWDIKAAQVRDLAEIQLGELRELLTLVARRMDTLAPSIRRHLGVFALCQMQYAGDIVPEPDGELRLMLADLVHGGGMDQGEKIVSDFRATTDRMLAAASMRVWPKPRGGRPPKRLFDRPPDEMAGHPAIKAFDTFVIDFVKLVGDCGGRPRLNKNTGTGKLIDALRIAQPHLPCGLIPSGILEPDEDGNLSGLSHLAYLRDRAMNRGQKPPRK